MDAARTSQHSTGRAVAAAGRGFWALIATQFQVAFNDNALRFLVSFMGLGMGLWLGDRGAFLALVGALFSAPFILFSMAGGYLADRFSKRRVTIWIKVFELGVMALTLAGLVTKNLPILLACVCLMGTHSAFFGPSKYGLLPELLPEARLSWGNGILEMGTFLAIILGSGAGAIFYEVFGGKQEISGLILVGLTVVGLTISLGITRVPPADPLKRFHPNFLREIVRQTRQIHTDRVLWLALLGNIYFSFLGMLVQQNLILYGTDTLRIPEIQVFYLMAALAVGIGTGSIAAGYMSGGKIEYGLVPMGSFGMVIFSALLGFQTPSLAGAVMSLALLGFSGGFFIVPISAILQHRPAKQNKGSVLATSNLLSFVGIFTASGLYYLLTGVMHFAPRPVFLAGALVTLAATIYCTRLLPDSLLRLQLWLLTNTLYRVRVLGRENLPEKGGALLIPNHLSRIDALLLIASTDRHIRFLMDKEWYDKQFLKPFARMLGVIPISSQQGPRELLASLRRAGEAIQAGQIVCIFAEGQITRIGQLLPFRRGFERIMKGAGQGAGEKGAGKGAGEGVDAPIIPVLLDNVWGSIFSFERGRFLWKWPKSTPHNITVSYGKPMPATSTPLEVRQAVQDLHSEAYQLHREWLLPLHREWLRTARRHPRRFAMGDARFPRVSFGAAVVRAIFLARRLRAKWRDQEKVGILLPPSVGGALINLAATLLGKVPVNLNYTASNEVIASCAEQCGLKTVVTSQAFLERVKLEVPGEPLLLEEMAARPRFLEQLAALALYFLPAPLLENLLGRKRPAELDDLATVIFSSGSTGTPKGVMLSHFNIAANIEQTRQIVFLTPRDRLLGILPLFHSMGFTVGLWLPAISGIGVVYHPNPVEAKAIGNLVRDYAVTFLVATPTFLQTYIRRCAPEDFGSLRIIVTGAEKLPERIARAFEDHFGVRVFEGYGTTECAPVVAANTGDFRAPGFRQVGAKRGKIGHPVPGLSVRIIHPETGESLPIGQQGLLLVKGPNIMQGYLNRPDKTAEVLRDGWYSTGDIAYVDEDGFLEITDRLSRFSKIGGEMVPHIKVEDTLQDLAGATEQVFAVTGVPDARKGERLVVLHTLSDAALEETLAKLSSSGLPNLWKPDPRHFYRIDGMPYLGSGKIDLRRLRELALQASPEA